jgi:2',3'-cyclic-nucleotide 2'-phosphodiesterase (5'-nucleotidase family)
VEAGDFAGSQPHEGVKTAFLLTAMYDLGYDAMTVGEREFNYGYKLFLEQAKTGKVPVVSGNVRDKASGKLLWKPYIVVKKNNVKVAIGGLLSKTIPLGPAQDSVLVDDPLAAARKLVAEMRKKADVVVLLAHMGRVDAEDIASQVPGIDVLVTGHHPGMSPTSRKVNNTVSVCSGEQGQNVGETVFDLDGKQATLRESRSVILLPEVGERADYAARVKTFEDEINTAMRKQAQETAVNTANQPGASRFLGMNACISCHQPQHEQWKTTAHSHAIDILRQQQKESTPECVQCHVTGWQQPGGFRSIATTEAMANVQCEVCHGMGTEHDMFAADKGPPPEPLCVTCHNPANDPSWNYAAKLPKVVH